MIAKPVKDYLCQRKIVPDKVNRCRLKKEHNLKAENYVLFGEQN